MANWKRLTHTDDIPVDVNMENVAYILGLEDYTQIVFIGGYGDNRLMVPVKQKPDHIHLDKPLRSV